MKWNFRRSLLAILLGNLVYFFIMRWLPQRLRHQPFQIDWGLVVDFWICAACWGLLRFVR